MKKWVLKRNKVDTVKMAEVFEVDEIISSIMANRLIGSYDAGQRFLKAEFSNIRPLHTLKDFDKAVELIAGSITQGKKIAVYGDYDVDGVSSTAILTKAIRDLGGDCVFYVPHRQKEGYGLNCDAVRQMNEEKIEVLLTCDNGIASLEEIQLAKELGLIVIVLDHHEPYIDEQQKEILPCADAVVDAKRRDSDYPFRQFCAGGLSYFFVRYLYQKMKIPCLKKQEYLAIAAIATICDIVDLLEENRILAKNGLIALNQTTNIGLKALINETGLTGKTITEYHVGFVLGPCINATGRLESAKTAVELLLTTQEQTAHSLAKELCRLNQERKNMTESAVDQVEEILEKEQLQQDKVLVIYCPSIHESIAGIVAGRIKEKYYKPVIVLTDGEEMAKGSARSIEGYHIFQQMSKCKDLFSRFGGHAMAAGLSLPRENIPFFRQRINEDCTLTQEQMTPILRIEKIVSFKQLSLELAKQLSQLGPFGKENPQPIFASCGILLESVYFMGKEKKMLRFSLLEENSGIRYVGVDFYGYENFISLIEQLYSSEKCSKIKQNGQVGCKVDIVYVISINEYQGNESLQLLIKDFRVAK